MPDADIDICAAADPLDPKPYELTDGERRALRKEGLIRPALAAPPRTSASCSTPSSPTLPQCVGGRTEGLHRVSAGFRATAQRTRPPRER